jgi:hypothetical protein
MRCGRLGSGISRHLLDAQGPSAKPDGLITQLPRTGDVELIGPSNAAKFRHSAVFVEPDAIGPCLAVVDFDAVCHGIGGDGIGLIAGKPRQGGSGG